MLRQLRRVPWPLLVSVVVLSLAATLLLTARTWVEWQWFAQFGWGAVIVRRWLLQGAGCVLGLSLGVGLQGWLGWLWGRPVVGPAERPRFGLAPFPYLLALIALLAAQMLPLLLLLRLAQRLLLNPFDPQRLHGLVALADLPWPAVALLAAPVLLALLRAPLLAPRLFSALASALAAVALARGWGFWILALLAPDAGVSDPMLGADVSFALVRFPALALGLTLALSLGCVHMAAALWGLLARPPQLSDGRFAGFSGAQLQALRLPWGLFCLVVAAGFWLGRHQLLLSTEGSVPGAGWVDVHVSLPLRTAAAVLALLTGLLLVLPLPRRGWRSRTFLLSGVALLLVLLLEALLLPVLQLLVVNPRELERETPYLARSIAATRAAFQLDRIDTRNVNPKERLTRADLDQSQATIRNIRLWDSQPLLATNRQLQQLRVFYRFSEPTVDRYAIASGNEPPQQQQVAITAREMDSSGLQSAARTWLNRHLVFTHGQGFTVTPVNTSTPDGLPEFFISDLGPNLRISGAADLGISREQVKAAIPVTDPNLYFGTLPGPYALAPTEVREFNFPEGDENFYTHYSGRAGVPLRSMAARLAAALYLGEPRLMVKGAITPETRLLLRREVRERVRRLVPFVTFEAEPYLATVRLGDDAAPFQPEQNQFWIVDGFTLSRTYPYSAPVPDRRDVRYVRNSVKAVVDAYEGRVALYVSEPDDPLISGWKRLFPELFQPLEAMPKVLQAHIRYPIPQFELQTTQLLRYHVKDPAVFYSGDDVWQIPKEIYGSELIPMDPYHISGQLSPELPPEFLLLQPLTPLARPNLTAWLAARSDAPNYGKVELLRFPSQTPILGPEQITALINQNPQISQQFGLWSRSGAEVVQGNLLVMPVGEALLYVEPVYLKARQGGLPTLTRVVVSDGTRIAMEPTLAEAIEALLDPRRSSPATEALVAPGQEPNALSPPGPAALP
ncbi:UPF0182 family protein [Synechococcus sp. CS-1329]|uniref:UPF0182 family protein n=1 Tax=Synechococcus sp. CS-1329 TaxID=2847975 RepID=UPI0021E389B9|nr:UPF0182 family protein [Synechococcus sp. CS-1329]MCT0217869.1 UPF0182 family protein [Synechococcus sp. CS-1329]